VDFFNHRDGGVVLYQFFLLSPLQCTVQQCTIETVRGCVSLKKYKSQCKAVDVTLNSKEENFFLDFVQEFGLSSVTLTGPLV
jgi:hypothetical protein